MKYTIHLYLIFLTVVVILMTWITGQFDNRPIQIIIVLLALLAGIAVLVGRVKSRRETTEEISILRAAIRGSE